MNEKTVWGIHGGRTGDADTLFLKKNYVALGWPQMGDLSTLLANRDAFKSQLAKCYPGSKQGAIPVEAGLLYRFTHEMQIGDVIVYPSKQDKQIHIGEIEGGYEYRPDLESQYPQVRRVKWSKELPRTRFTQGALYEIGSAMSFFQVRNYADEFLAAIEGKTKRITAPTEDVTVGQVAEGIEETTRDFILKQLAQHLKGHGLSHFVAHLLEKMGYKTHVSPPGADGGIDIIAHKGDLGFEPPIIKVQVKSSQDSVGSQAVQSLYGTLTSASECALFVTLGTFTPPAKNFANGKSNLRLLDIDDLTELVLQYYEQFDTRYKGILPLKRVYIPQPPQEDEG